MSDGNEIVKTLVVNGVEVDVYGCWNNDTPENEYDFYDLYVEGQCINEGEPYYERPTDEDIRTHFKFWQGEVGLNNS